jgi:hypothetical protein
VIVPNARNGARLSRILTANAVRTSVRIRPSFEDCLPPNYFS